MGLQDISKFYPSLSLGIKSMLKLTTHYDFHELFLKNVPPYKYISY
jgi:hypothetical protein